MSDKAGPEQAVPQPDESIMGTGYFDLLPNEIIWDILTLSHDFDAQPPSVVNFGLEPQIASLQSNCHPLKNYAVVCKRWRQLMLPTIFKYSRVCLPSDRQWLVLNEQILHSLSRSGRSEHEEYIYCKLKDWVRPQHEVADNARFADVRRRSAIRDVSAGEIAGFEFIKQSDCLLCGPNGPPIDCWRWIPSLKGEMQAYLDFVRANDLEYCVASLVVYTATGLQSGELTGAEDALINREVRKMWESVFSYFGGRFGRLERVMVAAPPSTMAALCNSREESEDTWAFEMPLHYAEFRIDAAPKIAPTSQQLSSDSNTPLSTSPTDTDSSPPRRSLHHESCLYNARPWTTLSYNEGASIAVYGHYEWQWKRPPRVFDFILRWLAKESSCRRCKAHQPRIALTSVSYTSLFPLGAHVRDIAEAMMSISSVQNLTVRLADPNILEDKERLGKGLADDCWTEWRSCYGAIVKDVLGNAKEGFTLESLDGTTPEVKKDLVSTIRNVRVANVVRDGEELRWVKQATK